MIGHHVHKVSIFFDAVVDFDDFASCQQLDDQGGRDDGTDAEFHAGSSVGRHDDARPIEGIGACFFVDAVERQLAAHEEHEQRHCGVQHFFSEGDPTIGPLHVWQHGHEGFHEVQHAESTGHDASRTLLSPSVPRVSFSSLPFVPSPRDPRSTDRRRSSFVPHVSLSHVVSLSDGER